MKKMINSRKIQMLLAIIIIAAVHLYNLPSLYSIVIIDDEFGYVGMGAQMAGYDWTTMLGTAHYYSYGFGILLSILFRIGLTGVSFFRAAVVLNVLFLIGSFIITSYITEEMIPCKWDVLIALAINLYSSNIFQCKLCWSEIILYFLTWLLILFIYQLNKKFEMRYLIGIVVTSSYMYTVHQRCLAIIIAAVIMIFLIWLNGHANKTNFYKLLCSFLLLAGLFLIACRVKEFIVENWYVAESAAEKRIAINDYAGQMNTLKKIKEPRIFLSMILELFGKLYGQALASGMLILFALAAAVKIFMEKVIKKIREKTPIKWTKEESFMLAASLMFLGALGVATVYYARTLGNQKYYQIVMTRYIDYTTGPMLLVGFYILADFKKHIKEIVVSLIGMAGLTFLTYFQFTRSGGTLFNSVNVASVYHILRGVTENIRVILAAGMGVILFSVFLTGLVYIGNRLKGADTGIIIAAVVMAGIFAYSGVKESAEFTEYKQQEVLEYVKPVIDYIEEKDWTGTIYYVGSGSDSYNFLKILQFLQPAQRIEIVEEAEIKELNVSDTGDLLISATREMEEYKLDEVSENLIMDTGRLRVYTLD